MKKLIFPFFVLGTIIVLSAGFAPTADAMDFKTQIIQAESSFDVSPDGDRVCPNYDGTQPGKGKGPGNGQGSGKAEGKGLGKGKGPKDGSGQGCNPGKGARR